MREGNMESVKGQVCYDKGEPNDHLSDVGKARDVCTAVQASLNGDVHVGYGQEIIPEAPETLCLVGFGSDGKQSESVVQDDEEWRVSVSAEISCGALGWHPTWLQTIASKKTYVLVFGLLGMNQQALGSYFIATISTIEKRFKIPSRTSGMIMSGWEIGALSTALIMAYFGSSGHKTRWVAFGAMMAALSCFIRLLPHLLFGPGEDAISIAMSAIVANYTLTNEAMCNLPGLPPDCSQGATAFQSAAILFTAAFMLGIGTSVYYTLGIAYLDDNTLHNKVPWLIALSTCIRMFGPTLGFLVASYTLRLYIDPHLKPSFDNNDPRWIGAWWLGWAPIGVLNMFFALLMALFPRALPRAAMRQRQANQSLKKVKKSFADFKALMLRLLKNRILMFNTASSTFYIFGLLAHYVFMPKYIETQFRISASHSSLITGSIGLLSTAMGVMVSGAVISKFRPHPRYLAAWNVFVEIIDMLGHISYAYLGCPKQDLHGSVRDDGSWDLITGCNMDCNCPTSTKYDPVCSVDLQTTFYSPCHAGCGTPPAFTNGFKIFSNCSCVPGLGLVQDGPCPVDCSYNFTVFLVILCTMRFFSSTGRAGNTIIQFRSVSAEDKAVSIAFTEAVVNAFAFIPAPIFYGSLLDYSCLVWGETCGETGHCWLYNGQTLRYLLNFTASGFLAVATVLDVGVWLNVKELQIYDESLSDKETPIEKK